MHYSTEKAKKQLCYKDYLGLPQDKRWELIEGIPYAMAPSPSTQHQRVLRKLFLQIGNFLAGKTCEVFSSPYDVLLPEEGEKAEDIRSVVQPDILVVCDKSKLTEKYCIGAPDLIIEIVSPSSPSMDYVKKLNLYEKHKVKEYWIVDPAYKQIMVYKLQDNKEYGKPEVYIDGEIEVGIFKGLIIKLEDIFE